MFVTAVMLIDTPAQVPSSPDTPTFLNASDPSPELSSQVSPSLSASDTWRCPCYSSLQNLHMVFCHSQGTEGQQSVVGTQQDPEPADSRMLLALGISEACRCLSQESVGLEA